MKITRSKASEMIGYCATRKWLYVTSISYVGVSRRALADNTKAPNSVYYHHPREKAVKWRGECVLVPNNRVYIAWHGELLPDVVQAVEYVLQDRGITSIVIVRCSSQEIIAYENRT